MCQFKFVQLQVMKTQNNSGLNKIDIVFLFMQNSKVMQSEVNWQLYSEKCSAAHVLSRSLYLQSLEHSPHALSPKHSHFKEQNGGRVKKKKKWQQFLAACPLKFLKSVTHFNHIFLFETWPFLMAREVGTFYSVLGSQRPGYKFYSYGRTEGEWISVDK